MNDSAEDLSPLKRALVEIRDLRARQADHDARRSEPIAIVGTGLRFPGGAVDRESLFALLAEGVDAIEEVPADRWDIDAFFDADPDAPGRMMTRWGGFVPDVDHFDAEFFGIAHREAESMDPQQRLLLTTVWEALEDASIAPESLFGTDGGVFLGVIANDYLRMLFAERERIDSYAASGGVLSVASGRVAYVLGIEGPAISYDTACSSSLVSIHAACQSLRNRECSLAIAGGVQLNLAPELTINHSHARMMAADGRCKTFDAAADGYVRSEGCGVLVLKRLSDAQRDGDRILALIRGSALNQDGRSSGLTAPNGPSQVRVMRAALESAGLSPGDVSYVEAHGTGTPLGDPIEMQALHSVYGEQRGRENPLPVGSIKTNLGHTEAAAGIAGLLKAVVMLENDTIAPNLHLEELNPYLAEYTDRLTVPTTSRPWPRPDSGRVAAVSSFGLSGTNAHVLVSDPPPREDVATSGAHPTTGPLMLPLSSRTDHGLESLADAWTRYLDDASDVSRIVTAAALGRGHLDRRLVALGSTAAELAERLRSLPLGDDVDGLIPPAPLGTPANHIAFLFSGHGGLRPGDGRHLYRTEPAFAEAFDRCADWLAEHNGNDLRQLLFDDSASLGRMAVAQPALFALQYSLHAVWASRGIHPTVVAGHSAGEYVAAVVSDAMSLDDGLLLVSERGRLMDQLEPGGEMIALFAPEADVAPAVEAYAAHVGIAAVNGPNSTVVSGRPEAIAAIIADLELEPDETRRLDISVAAHSPLLDPILDEFDSVVSRVTMQSPALSVISSMTGRPIDGAWNEPGYWTRHLREAVRFGDVFDTLRQMGCGIFVELGPHRTLLAAGSRTWPDNRAVWAPSMHHDVDEPFQLHTALAQVYTAGVDLDWETISGTSRASRPHVHLPTRPWNTRSYWAPERASASPTPTAIWTAATEAANRRSDRAPIGMRVDSYDARWELTTRLSLAAMTNAFIELGAFPTDTAVPESAMLASAGIIDEQSELVRRWIDHLVEADVLVRTATGLVAHTQPERTDLRELISGSHTDLAGIEPLIDYLVSCADALADVVTGRESPLNTLFPDGRYDIVDYLYHHWDIPAYYNGIVAAAVAAAAAARGGRLRVLEVGAGTGGTAGWVLPEIGDMEVDYTFTDVSDFFLARARERFADHGRVRFGLLDLEGEPDSHEHTAGSFDIVLASNVLHATTDLDRTLGHVRTLLAPGGLLIAFEATEHPTWADISTGLIEGWQRFADEWRTDVPLIDAATWTAALSANGFAEVRTEPADDLAATLLHHVVMAKAPGDELTARPRSTAFDDEAIPVVAASLATSAQTAERLAAALPDERVDVLVDIVREVVGAVLRTPDPASLSRDMPLLDLGFDSLMAVELRNSLREVFGLEQKLPATLAFDQPTIAHIASFIDDLMAGPASSDPESTAGGSTDLTAYDDLDAADVEAALLARLEELEG